SLNGRNLTSTSASDQDPVAEIVQCGRATSVKPKKSGTCYGVIVRTGPHWDAGLGPRSVSVLAAARGFHSSWGRVAGQSRRHVHPLRDSYFVPASGYSHLELYLMGLIAADEVPDFFIVSPCV